MPTSSKPARRPAANPSARPASAASRAKPRARNRASETPPPDIEDDDTPPPVFTPAQIRARHDGWSPERQVRFVEALAESGCVEEACRTVGLSKQSAYSLRMRVDAQGFRMAWEAAMELAIRRLSDECYARALHGEEVPHYYQGELIGTHRRYDNKLAMFLLRYRDPLRYAATLDQMVYSGHPEGAALAFAKARDRCADEAWGVADQPIEDTAPEPFEKRPITEARLDPIDDDEPMPSDAADDEDDWLKGGPTVIIPETGQEVPHPDRIEDPIMRAFVEISLYGQQEAGRRNAERRRLAEAAMPSSSSTSDADPPLPAIHILDAERGHLG